MKLFKKDGSEVELAEKEYVDSKCKYVKTDGWGVGEHEVDLNGVNAILLNIQNNSNQAYTIPFIANTYYSNATDSIDISVNFYLNVINILYLPSGYKLKSYLLIY